MSDEFSRQDFVLWVFMYPNNITLFFDSILASISYLFCVSSTATTPRATTTHLYCKGYHAFTTARLPRLCINIPATTPQIRAPFLAELSHVNWPPELRSSSQFPDHRLLRHPSSPLTPPPGRHTYQPTPHPEIDSGKYQIHVNRRYTPKSCSQQTKPTVG